MCTNKDNSKHKCKYRIEYESVYRFFSTLLNLKLLSYELYKIASRTCIKWLHHPSEWVSRTSQARNQTQESDLYLLIPPSCQINGSQAWTMRWSSSHLNVDLEE